jgi:homoserine O-succinyltransferase
MPIKIPDNLPAHDILTQERIEVMSESTAIKQDIRPLKIILFNLMPDKITTETQIARVLGSSPLQIELTLLRTESYVGKNTAESHLTSFYKVFDDISHEKFDGIIVTGAPIEHMKFEDVQYWEELTKIMNWADKNCHSQFYICWAAQAALYHFYAIEKRLLGDKHFGVFPHPRLDFTHPITRGFDDVINIPVSRYTEIDEEAVIANPDLSLLLTSNETGSALIADTSRRKIFMLNHLEYDRETLKGEYDRDAGEGLGTPTPKYYFPDNNPQSTPTMNWRAHRNLLFLNWVNIVYQSTPYDMDEIGE